MIFHVHWTLSGIQRCRSPSAFRLVRFSLLRRCLVRRCGRLVPRRLYQCRNSMKLKMVKTTSKPIENTRPTFRPPVWAFSGQPNRKTNLTSDSSKHDHKGNLSAIAHITMVRIIKKYAGDYLFQVVMVKIEAKSIHCNTATIFTILSLPLDREYDARDR